MGSILFPERGSNIYIKEDQTMRKILVWLAAGLIFGGISSMVLVSCGGGGGGSTGISGYSKGVITAKGSIFVNGIEFDTNSASIDVNGSTGTDADLKVGMEVEVKGEIDDNSGTGKAAEIRFADNLEGPISAISGSTLTVLGQTITIDAKTHFEAPLTGMGSLNVGDAVEVSGLPNPAGGILATFIEKKTGLTEYEIKGIVSLWTSPNGSTFTLTPANGSGLSVTLGTGIGLPSGFDNGKLVEVKIDAASGITGPHSVTAKKIELENELEPEDIGRAEIEGLVANLSGNTFTVNGTKVNAGTLSLAGLANGVRVDVEGTLTGGVLMATKIHIHS